MAVTFFIPGPLRSFTSGASHIAIEQTPATLADALEALWQRCPGLRDRLMTEQAEIRGHINVFVGNENVRHAGGLKTPLPDGAEVTILPSVSGGVPPRGPSAPETTNGRL